MQSVAAARESECSEGRIVIALGVLILLVKASALFLLL